jgi:FkbH-like protein
LNGIVCDKNSEGILYYSFQLFLKARKEEGFLLCLCSKNNEADVKEAFERNGFPLKWDDFIVKKINWEDKVGNISDIAKELNISTDSFIFIDDNLFELNSVKEFIPGIECLHLSGNYKEFLILINSLLFRRKQILAADKEKTKHYETEQIREKEKSNFSSLEGFIKSLEIRLDIRLNDLDDLQRLSQMTEKTNQFNFNKHAYTADELKAFIDENNKVYSLKVNDKYGNYGTVGLLLVKIEVREFTIENYLLSCRVLGKGIENKFYDSVINELLKRKMTLKEIKFVKTPKNSPAQTFLNQLNLGNK